MCTIMDRPVEGKIIQIGSSKGVRIPKKILDKCNFNGGPVSFTLTEAGDLILSRPKEEDPHQGWEEAVDQLLTSGEDGREELIEIDDQAFDQEEWDWPMETL